MADAEKAKRLPEDEEDPKSKAAAKKKRDRQTFSGQNTEVRK